MKIKELRYRSFMEEDIILYNLKGKKEVGQGTCLQGKSKNKIRCINFNSSLYG